MSPLISQSVLFFRLYREVTVPLYAGMVERICASPEMPFELATTLEDIGQAFIRFAETLNAELLRRGILDDEVEADGTVEAGIEALVETITAQPRRGRADSDDRLRALMADPSTHQAIKAALVMVQDLPIARRTLAQASEGEASGERA